MKDATTGACWWWHRFRRWIDAVVWLWWANGDTAIERRNWFDCVTKRARHWTCACGNDERRERRSYILNDVRWERWRR